MLKGQNVKRMGCRTVIRPKVPKIKWGTMSNVCTQRTYDVNYPKLNKICLMTIVTFYQRYVEYIKLIGFPPMAAYLINLYRPGCYWLY
jgi:hypothetical protein